MYWEPGDRAWEAAKAVAAHLQPPRFVAVASAALFSAGTLARTFEIPSRAAWDAGRPLGWLLLLAGLIAGISGVVVALKSARRKREGLLSEACLRLAAYIDEECPSVDLRDVGVHVWLVAGPPWARRLHRGPEFLLRERQRSNVIFTEGKGVLGQVWAAQVDAVFDLEAESAWVASEADFDRLDPAVKRGLTWIDFQRTRRYKAIWAAPLSHRSGQRVLGVISVDIQTSGAFDELARATVAASRSPELDAILAACERALSD